MKQIKIPKLPRPTLAALQKEWDWIKSIEKDISQTKATDLIIGSVLKQGETYISGEEYEKRWSGAENLLGLQQAQWLLENQDKFPEFKAMTEIYINFPGIIVVNAYGSQIVPCLDQNGSRWYLHWHWLGDGFDGHGRIASSGKLQTRTLGTSVIEKAKKYDEILKIIKQ